MLVVEKATAHRVPDCVSETGKFVPFVAKIVTLDPETVPMLFVPVAIVGLLVMATLEVPISWTGTEDPPVCQPTPTKDPAPFCT